MKNYTKFPIKIEYKKINIKISFVIPIIDLDKYIKDGYIYPQIIADDNTRPVIKKEAEIKIDKVNAIITINTEIEIYDKYLRGRNGDSVYIKHINKLTTEDLKW